MGQPESCLSLSVSFATKLNVSQLSNHTNFIKYMCQTFSTQNVSFVYPTSLPEYEKLFYPKQEYIDFCLRLVRLENPLCQGRFLRYWIVYKNSDKTKFLPKMYLITKDHGTNDIQNIYVGFRKLWLFFEVVSSMIFILILEK